MERKRIRSASGPPACLEQRRQGTPPDELHRNEQTAVGKAPELVDRDDPGVLKLAANLGLLDETAHHLGLVTVLLPNHLDGEVPAEVESRPWKIAPIPPRASSADQLVTRRLASRARASRLTSAGSSECPLMCLGDELAGLH